jgi:hypothetical protein
VTNPLAAPDFSDEALFPLWAEISGWPLGKPDEDDEPVALPVVRVSIDEQMDNGDVTYVMDHDSALVVLHAWKAAPAVDYDTGETEWLRDFEWHEAGEVFATALSGDGELNIDWWAENSGCLYTADWPWDFEIRILTDEEVVERGLR